jgi:hypothetical protein
MDCTLFQMQTLASDVRSDKKRLGIEEKVVMNVLRYFEGKELVEIVPIISLGLNLKGSMRWRPHYHIRKLL